MGNLKPGKTIAYEKDDQGRVWGRYHGETERWLVGGPAEKSALNEYQEWRELKEAAEQNPTLRALLEKTINTYRLIKQ